MIMFFALLTAVVWKIFHWSEVPAPFTLFFAMILLGQHWILFAIVWKSIKNAREKSLLNDTQPEMQTGRSELNKTRSGQKKN
jgi:hypothetical protein